jgi:thioredoxin-like negative regulator of GroEL/glutathione synthase/RimK-type ligase-like ATP-grasp enzyme
MTKTSSEDFRAGRERAIALHKAGKIKDAAAIYSALLAAEPGNRDILGLLSVAQLGLGEAEAAVANWRKCLALEPAVPNRLRLIANFLAALKKLARMRSIATGFTVPDTAFLADIAIPDWPADTPLGKESQAVVLDLAHGLVQFDRRAAGFRLLDSALLQLSNDPEFVTGVATVMLEAGETEKALQLLNGLSPKADRDNAAVLIVQAAAVQAAGRREEAESLSRRARDAVPVCLSEKMPQQRMLIGVLNEAARIIKQPATPFALHFSANIPAALVARMNEEFRFVSIYPEATDAQQALKALPAPQLIINNWVNGEMLSVPGTLDFIATFADSFGVPVINHPGNAQQTTRQLNAERLAGIKDLIVPRIIRIMNEPQKRDLVLKEIASTIGFPVIIRNPASQQGSQTRKIDTPAELATLLAQWPHPQLYAIEYVNNEAEKGFYRKMRAVVINGELFMLHAHFAPQWNVHRSREAHKLEPGLRAFASKVVSHPQEMLGEPAMAALGEISKRIPLDIFGIDFDLTADGRVLFFEANASMRISLTERDDVSEARLAMREAYRRLFGDGATRLGVSGARSA